MRFKQGASSFWAGPPKKFLPDGKSYSATCSRLLRGSRSMGGTTVVGTLPFVFRASERPSLRLPLTRPSLSLRATSGALLRSAGML